MSEIFNDYSFDTASFGYVDYKIYDLSKRVNSELDEIKNMIKGNSGITPVSAAVSVNSVPDGIAGHFENMEV